MNTVAGLLQAKGNPPVQSIGANDMVLEAIRRMAQKNIGALVVLRELAPYAALVPPWLLIGLSGTLLTVVGVTWESRMQDLRHASRYVGELR